MKCCKFLVCACFSVSILLSGNVIPGNGSLHSATGGTRAAAADTTEKSKIKNKIEETKEGPLDNIIKTKKKKSGPERKTEESRYEEVSEEKSSFWGSCLGDLLGSLCSGMFSSALGGDDEETAQEVELEEPVAISDVTKETPAKSGPNVGDIDTPDTLPYTATVMPVSASETTVLLWDRPGGEAMQATVLDTLVHATVLDTLAMGAEVSVIKISQIGTTFWVKVVTAQEPRIIGWIREKEASPIEVPDTRK